MSLTPITLPIKAPVGAGFERVSKTDTRLINHPLVHSRVGQYIRRIHISKVHGLSDLAHTQCDH